MSKEVLRRAALDEKVKKQIRDRVQKILQKKQKDDPEQSDSAEEQPAEGEESPEGTVYLFDASDHSGRSMVALEFDTKKEFETYKKTHDVDPKTKVKILENGPKKPAKKDAPGSRRGPGKDDAAPKKPAKDEEKKDSKPKQSPEPKKDQPDKKDKKDSKPADGEKTEERKPGEPLEHSHPVRIPEGMQRQVAIKDKLIDEFGADAKSWKVHKIHPSQLSYGVMIKFPDGASKRYGQLSPEEKTRVDEAVKGGLAASKGLSDYTSVSPAAFQSNMKVNLDRYDNPDVEPETMEDEEPVSKENLQDFSSAVRENGRTLLKKYAKSMSRISRPMAEKFVDDMTDSISEGVRDGSMSGVSQKDLDGFMQESVKRMLHQEIETRRRSLGDHGIRHVMGDIQSASTMLDQLKESGISVTGKQKLMSMAALVDHDIGYTVGDVGTDISKGKKHKDYSKDLTDQEPERMDKIFGKEDGDRVRTIIATHDDPTFDWDKDPVGSSVRLADNVSLFGKEKVQDLFLRSPKATELACKMRLAAEAKPDDKKLLKDIKEQMHEVVDGDEFEEPDREALHGQIDEMSEGKFSTTTDILSRFSGELDGFKYDSEKKIMNVNMKFSSEGQMVDQLFGDEVACKQFDKFAKDLYGKPIRGKRGSTQFKSMDSGEPVFQLNIDGFAEEETPQTAAMRDFADKTARTELRRASMLMYPPPPAGEKDIEKAKKVLEPAKKKFSEAEWKKLMEAFDSDNGDPVAIAKQLGMWPLLQSEMAFLTGKTASERRAFRVALDCMAERVAMGLIGSRGCQTQRKDKDLMSDTGGISKNRQRSPDSKPPRSDSSNRYRTKDKTPDQRDPDVDKKEASVHPMDSKVDGAFGFGIPENNYHRQVWSALIGIISEIRGTSEKDFAGMDLIMSAAENLVRSPLGDELIQAFQTVGARPKMCAEGLYFETFVRGREEDRKEKTASSNPEAMARSQLASLPRTLREAVSRG
jgi:hypothetical protein